ncbi:TonB-dependent receptor [Salipiger manganoxidans]|uniref:TonB-dependent receptor plug domain-containing protein n=1 Tax=Salipiger marinus TaxID=555512 RepID=UPI001E52B0F5|nr:TonB-dependent receptor [Salipiger manganoxidans]MCD1618803.1 TonB-dependent receptor [Salipiger manganoxidans]
MTRTHLLAALAASTLLTPLPLLAQDAYDLGEIVLSGGLSEIAADRYGRASTVLTRAEIEERGIATVQDALRAVPGLSVTSSGSSFTAVRIRGAEAAHTLILIDGIEAAAGDGNYALSGLETANIERIEVLRGPQSVFYGSDASAGVINIITRKGSEGRTLRSTLEIGVGQGWSASAFAANRSARGGVSLSLAYAEDEGFDTSGDGGEKDGINRGTAILSGDHMIGDALKLGFTLRRSREDYEYDSNNRPATGPDDYVVDDKKPYSNRWETTAGLFGEYATPGSALAQRLSLETTRNAQSHVGDNLANTRTDAAKYRLSFALDGRDVAQTDHLLNTLLEWERDDSSSNPEYERETASLALEYRGRLFEGFDLQAGLRHDDNTRFDDITTWTLGLSWQLENGMRLHASGGKGVVNPSYFDLYADNWGYVGNPDLTPEINTGWDLGVELPVLSGRGTVDLTYFREDLADEITEVSLPGGGISFFNQSGESSRKGVELSGQVQATDALGLRLGYTWLNAENPDGSVEVRSPEHELTLGATLAAFDGRGTFTADLRHVAGNYGETSWGDQGVEELPAFTTVDVAARYALNDRLTLTGRVTNLFDKDAVEVWGYANRGRAVYVGLSSEF